MGKYFSSDLRKLSCCTAKACLQEEKIISVLENLWNLFHHISNVQQNERVT